MYKCPHCNEIIEELGFTASTQGWESGIAILSDNEEEPYDRVVDYDYADSGTDETDNYEYTCPACSHTIYLRDLIWENDPEEELITYLHIPCYTCNVKKLICTHKVRYCKHCKFAPKELEPEETLHKIITPKNKIILENEPQDATENGIMCKNKKCKYIFVYERIKTKEKDSFCECPKCGTTNSINEYEKTINKESL